MAIFRLRSAENEVLVVARDKDCTFQLLKELGVRYFSRGKGRTGILGRIVYLYESFFLIRKIILSNKPDVLVCFGSPYFSLIRRFNNIPLILATDTEPNKYEKVFFKWPDVILTPASYLLDHGKKHKRFNGIKELAYLKPVSKRETTAGQKKVLVRFVSHSSIHYSGQNFDFWEARTRLIEKVASFCDVEICSEEDLPDCLLKYNLNVKAAELHTKYQEIDLLISESATMSAEASVCGVPVVMISDLNWGYIRMLETNGYIKKFRPDIDGYNDSIKYIEDIICGNSIPTQPNSDFFENCDDVGLILKNEIDSLFAKSAR